MTELLDSVPSTTVRTGLPRPVEAVLAILGLAALSPLLLAAAAAVRLGSRGPVLFSQERIGRAGVPFQMRKLRTMRTGSQGPSITSQGDSRITTVGAVLRRTKIDELPELWNVIRGDMSLVGPRPEVRRYVDLLNPLWRAVLQVRPGLTDPVTLRLRNEERLMAQAGQDWETFYVDVLQPYKLAGYYRYLQTRSPVTDLAVLLRTVAAIIRPSSTPPPDVRELRRAAPC